MTERGYALCGAGSPCPSESGRVPLTLEEREGLGVWAFPRICTTPAPISRQRTPIIVSSIDTCFIIKILIIKIT